MGLLNHLHNLTVNTIILSDLRPMPNRQVFLELVITMTHAIKHAAVQRFVVQDAMPIFLVPWPQFVHLLVVTVRKVVTIGLICTLAQYYWSVNLTGKMVKLVRVHVAIVSKDINFLICLMITIK